MTIPINHDLIALGIRQPWAELILRGVKTIEVRRLHTKVRGPIYLYAGKKIAGDEIARAAAQRAELDLDDLPTGLLLGTVEVRGSRALTHDDAAAACVPPERLDGYVGWELAHPRRLKHPVKSRFLPYGVWFYPFKRCKQ